MQYFFFVEENSNIEEDFVQQAFKKQRTDKEKSAYINTSFLAPTSNDVERLFSLAKRLYEDHRKSLNDRTFECLLFLKVNVALWDIKVVSEAIRMADAEIDSDSDDDN